MRKITVGVMAVTIGCKGAANLIEIVFLGGRGMHVRMSLSSFQIEKMSDDGLSRILAKSKRMAPYIKENDKMPIWDGEIILYSKDGQKA